MKAIDRFQRFNKKIYNSQDILKNHILDKYPIHYTDDVDDLSQIEQYAEQSDYVWLIDKNIELYRSFPLWLKVSKNKDQTYMFPYVYKKSKRVMSWKKVQLVPTKATDTKKVTLPHICGEYDVYMGKNLFDVFFIGNKETGTWEKLINKLPHAIAVDSYQEAIRNSQTDMFWVVWDDLIVDDKFNFNYVPDEWSFKYPHVFANNKLEQFDGICLMPKNYIPTDKELEFRFFVSKKQVNQIASKTRNYDIFKINNYDDYKNAMEETRTYMFWGVPSDVEVNFDFNLNIEFINRFDREITHVFKNDEHYDGVVLFSKHVGLTEKELTHRFYANKKEWDVVTSTPKPFDYFDVDTYSDYLAALDQSSTDMFWVSSKNIEVDQDLIKNFYISHHNIIDRNQNHAFKHVVDDSVLYNGLFLCSKNKPLTEREVEHRFLVERKEWDIVGSTKKKYDQFIINNYPDYLHAKQNSVTEMFWGIPSDVDTNHEFDLYFEHQNSYDRNITHVFKNNEHYDGVVLFSKHASLTEKELTHRFYANKKEWDIVVSNPKSYDYFDVDTYSDYVRALDESTTDMFWLGSKNIEVDRDLIKNFYISHHSTVDRNQNHAFVHQVDDEKYYNGLFLVSKNKLLTEREVEHRFLVERKEWDIVGSTKKSYDVFEIDSYSDYLTALETSTTEMFWMSSRNIDATIPGIYFTHNNEYDRKQNHAFIHRVGEIDHYNGLFLCSKHMPLTQKEIDYRHVVNAKEWNIVGSTKKIYDIFVINNYVDYFKAFESSNTEMFWGVPSDVEVKFEFDLYFTHNNEYDRKINHVMLNGIHRDGVVLFSKHSTVTEKEIENRFYVNKKEWDVVASVPKQYEKFIINDYPDYLNALETTTTELFWMIPPEVVSNKDFDFNLYFPHHEKFEREMNHVFMNGPAYDGISLISKKSFITEKEIDMRFFANKKQYSIVASNPHPYDIVFISKDEEHADKNYQTLLDRFPDAKRVHGVNGIHQAHIAAAKLCSTDMIWIVDADAEIIPKFNFDYYVPAYDPDSRKTVHVWKAQNPINSLVYGYGAVKLLPREMTINMDTSKPDMTTSISPYFKPINRISNVTKFNTDPFSSWRSAFRETVKLASKSINGQLDEETDFRLNIWCTKGKDKLFGEYCIAGAVAGKAYGLANTGNLEALKMINDFAWLKQQFDQTYELT